jgi:hypothetical protein
LSSVFALSKDGSHLIGSSFGAFSGTEGDGLGDSTNLLGAAYELSRTGEPASWTAASIEPPRSLYRSNGLFDASADLSRTLWELGRHRLSSPGAAPSVESCPSFEEARGPFGESKEEELQPEGLTDFYIEGPRGAFTRVGPATPDPCAPNGTGKEVLYTYLGASANLSHILFSTQVGLRWSFDKTVGESNTLYEYAGTGHEPSLVGVDSGGSLVSECGTRLGSGSSTSPGSMYNAISVSGERIFFTAVGKDDNACGASQPLVDELFVREELPATEGELPAGEARTVAISEPSEEDCKACLSSSELRDAHFEGASRDGSKAFFTTEQELLPDAASENLYEYDGTASTGKKIIRVSVPPAGEAEVQGVVRISQDGSHVYFVAKGKLTGKNLQGEEPVSGEDNLYLYERNAQFPEGHRSFIVTLSPSDEPAVWGRADDRLVQISSDGNLLVFTSRADLTHEEVVPGRSQVFQYDATAGSLVRASIGQDGYNNDNRTPSSDATIAIRPSASYAYSIRDSPTQTDGILAPGNGAVFFTSSDALTPQALNNQTDTLGQPVPNIYEYRAGHVYLISDGRDESTLHSEPSVSLLGSDSAGENVFFTTSDPLINQDTDTQQDVYDARMGGGTPNPTGSPICNGEGCHSALGGPPGLSTPASRTESAEAGVSPALPSTRAKPTTKVKKKTKRKHKRGKKAGRRSDARVHGRGARR